MANICSGFVCCWYFFFYNKNNFFPKKNAFECKIKFTKFGIELNLRSKTKKNDWIK